MQINGPVKEGVHPFIEAHPGLLGRVGRACGVDPYRGAAPVMIWKKKTRIKRRSHLRRIVTKNASNCVCVFEIGLNDDFHYQVFQNIFQLVSNYRILLSIVCNLLH